MAAPDVPAAIDHGAVEKAVHVHLHPRLVDPAAFAGGVALVIDNLRASVTIAAALCAGAAAVRPVLTVEDARECRRRACEGTSTGTATAGAPLLGGERGGERIEGFDLDNSPAAYTREACAGREVVFTTTNGTAALLHAARAARVIVASLANLSAVVAEVAGDPRPVHILCAGTRDEVSVDDVLPAGAFVERLLAEGRDLGHGDGARLALLTWRQAARTEASLVAAMRGSRGGRNLAAIGLGSDVERCTTVDRYPVVPEFDAASGLIRAAGARTPAA
jgi:2-phosphosulfolactate phosphatase